MEDLNAYKESGVLELYVLGSLTETEMREVEQMLTLHPELKREVEEIERASQRYAEAHAIPPSENLREQILSSLDTSASQVETPVVPLKTSGTGNFYKYAFAASVALLLLSIISIINLSSQLRERNSEIALLQQSNQRFSSRVNFVEGQLKGAQQTLKVFRSPEQYQMVSLKGTPKAPAAKIIVAFNSEKAEVMIDLASVEMPSTDENHQYQLWALVDGKPVDLGVFDTKTDSSGMIKMKSLRTADAFAVTLEPRGGSINPTLEQMMAMGAI